MRNLFDMVVAQIRQLLDSQLQEMVLHEGVVVDVRTACPACLIYHFVYQEEADLCGGGSPYWWVRPVRVPPR